MSELLKDVYTKTFFSAFGEVLADVLPDFPKEEFIKRAWTPAFRKLELKERATHTIGVLENYLDSSYEQAALQIEKITRKLQQEKFPVKHVEFMFLPEFIARRGLQDLDTSIRLMETVTTFITCEFAVRPFLLQQPDRMMQQMQSWSRHENRHVRRLASEGCRPRLPWAMGVPFLKQQPERILPILEELKQDSCEVVRRSVANNLNDISKDHPELVLDVVSRWKGLGYETDALVRHASRTLLKSAHPGILELYGLDGRFAEVAGFRLHRKRVLMGADLIFSAEITNRSEKPQTLRLEYAVYFLRQNGSQSKKVFKISDRAFVSGETYRLEKKHSFRPITTRVYYPGQQAVSIIVNGEEKAKLPFVLLE